MAEIQNRTLICSVLFIDIVEYSRKPVVEQLHLKDRFNASLTEALRDVAAKDRVIIDTGDGAACTFTADPEDALFVAARLQQRILQESEADMSQLAARVGINLGPVRLVKDINGQPNVIGDGINVAQRIMSFAQPGQVLVSRSYHDAVSRLSGESSNLFTHEGSRTDKHIRDHEVYALCLTAAAEQKRCNDKRKAIFRAREALANGRMLRRATEIFASLRVGFRDRRRLGGSLLLATLLATAVAYGAYTNDLFPGEAAPVQPASEAHPDTVLTIVSADGKSGPDAMALQVTDAVTLASGAASVPQEAAGAEANEPPPAADTAKAAIAEPAIVDLHRRQSARRKPSAARSPLEGRQAQSRGAQRRLPRPRRHRLCQGRRPH
jgi:class 3 adenylate cyclase